MIYDISRHNDIRWLFVRAKAIFVRVAYDREDSKYQKNRRMCRALNIEDYGYGWNLPTHDSAEQGKFVGKLSAGMKKFALDVEKVQIAGNLIHDVRPAGEYLRWWDAYEDANPGAQWYTYTNLSSWRRVQAISMKRDVQELADITNLWVAAYGFPDVGNQPDWTPTIPAYFDDYTLWQYTGRGKASGFNRNVDINVLHPDIDMDKWLDKKEPRWTDMRQAWAEWLREGRLLDIVRP